MALNVTTAVIGSGCNTATASPSLAQWDNGQILQIEGADLPDTYKVEFSNGETLSAIPAIGTAAGVPIPDELLYSSSPITAYIVLTDESSRDTEYWATIYVTPRQIPEGVQPDPEESAVIDQLIAQLNSGVERAEKAASMLENVDAAATTLQPGSPATAEYSDGVFEFGIPQGEKGDPFTYEDFTEEEKAELVQGPILDAQTSAVAAVGDARISAVNDVNAAGTTQVGNVNSAGTAQVQAVEDKGEEVIGSIPPDYSDLTAEVSDLNNAITTLDGNVNIVELYSGIPNNAATLFNIDGLQGAKSFYYNFDAVEDKYLYIELMNSSGSRISYIGKGSSSSGALHYEGYENVPESFSYAKFTTNADIASGYKINVIGFYPTSEMYQKTIKGFDVSYVFPEKYTDYYVDNRVVTEDGQRLVSLSYGFSLANMRLNAGKKLAIVVPNYSIIGHLYNEYGDWVRMIGRTHEVFKYEATENCYLRCNIIADDTTVTFNDDFVEKSGVEVYSDQENDISPNSAQIISRVYIPASQHGNNKVIRIPSAKIMPNKKIIVAYEVRNSLSDASNSFLGYTIVNNGVIESHGSIAEKESGEIRQFNPQLYTLQNGNILVLWTSNDANNTLYMHYAVSEDYGITWSTAGTMTNTSEILTAPANGVWYNDKILIPVYTGSDFYDTSTLYSGLMLIDPANMSHTEKFVAVARTNECNVFLNDDTALLSARQDGASGASGGTYRHMFTIDASLSGTFVEHNNFYLISAYRTICQESYYKTNHMLYLCMANQNRVGIKLYASNDLSRKWTKLVDVLKVTCNGYSCIDIEDNSMVVVTEGEDGKTTLGKQMFLDSVVIGSTV